MFFHLKHRWQIALIATGVGGLLSWQFDAFTHLTAGPWSLGAQIGIGFVAGILSLVCDGVLHEIFKRTLGQAYLRGFHRHGQVVLGRMRWPEYITGGLMATLAEEPLFRGILLVVYRPRCPWSYDYERCYLPLAIGYAPSFCCFGFGRC